MIKPKKIVLINEASSRIGLGHLRRCQALGSALLRSGYEVTFLSMVDQWARGYINNIHTDIKYFSQLQLIESLESAQSFIQSLEHVKKVLIDLSSNHDFFIDLCKKLEKKTIALDYFQVGEVMPNMIINLIDHHPDAILGKKPKRTGVLYFEGVEFAIIRDEFVGLRELALNRNIKKNVGNVLLSFGGSDPGGNTIKVLSQLLRWPGQFKIKIVAGPLYTGNIEEYISKLPNKNHIELIKNPKSLGSLIIESDIVFCGGGGTLLEVIYLGVPALVLPQNKAEARHSKLHVSNGACGYFDSGAAAILSQDVRKKMRDKSLGKIDGLGLLRIVSQIEKITRDS
jgi:spore coat polysaccharide biosynthesis predicted glycosyltransferase SpsG